MKRKQSLAKHLCSVALISGILAFLLCFVVTPSTTTFAAPPPVGFARIIHAAPGTGNVDVFVDGIRLLNNFAFGTVTPYAPLPSGWHRIQVAPTGQGLGSSMINQMIMVVPGVPYTLAAIGVTAPGFALMDFADNNLLPAGMNQAKSRIYHLSPDAGPVNVASGRKTVVSELVYPSASGYLTMPAGTYTFTVIATQSGVSVPVQETLRADTVNSIFAIGLVKGTPAFKFVMASVPTSSPVGVSYP